MIEFIHDCMLCIDCRQDPVITEMASMVYYASPGHIPSYSYWMVPDTFQEYKYDNEKKTEKAFQSA